jgi:uncharacterized DUF497 family protein
MSRKTKTRVVYGKFEWDADKARSNFEEHEVTFEQAAKVFDDPLFIVVRDPDHSVEEQRYIIIGESQPRHYVIVSYTERGARTRIISARELDPRERRDYETNRENS